MEEISSSKKTIRPASLWAGESNLRRHWSFFSFVLLLMSVGAGAVLAKPGQKGAKNLPPAGYLDLTEEQKLSAEEIFKRTRESVTPLRQEARALRGALRELLDAEPQDATVIGETTLEIHALREEIHAQRELANADFKAILDAEQEVKWQNFLELRALAKRPRHGGASAGE